MRALAAALVVSAGAASAQVIGVTNATPEQLDFFRTCRAAVFYHLDPGSAQGGLLPQAFADTLGQQITFIMWNTITAARSSTLAETRAALGFTERFFLTFSQKIAERRDLQKDVAAREALLIACQPVVWSLIATQIDQRMASHGRIAAPAPPPAQAP